MKTVTKVTIKETSSARFLHQAAVAALLSFSVILPTLSAMAADAGLPTIPTTSAAAQPAGPATAVVASVPPSINLPAPPNALSASADTAPDTASTENNDKKTAKNMKALENKVTDSAKDLVKRLGVAPGDLTLDDLNAAKITEAKIDAMIEIEKRLAELDRIREDRAKTSGVSMSSSIPTVSASAFQPPALPVLPVTPPRQTFAEEGMPPMVPQPVSMEVARIVGTDGHYSAVITSGNGQTKTVHVGDKLSDGSVIIGITNTGVTVRQSTNTKVLSVKGVDTVYGRSL